MLKKIKNILKEHWLAIILAGLMGIMVSLPNLLSVYNIGIKDFKGIYPIYVDDAEHYLARTREVLDGHPGLGNVYFKENKNVPYMAPPLAEIILANLAKFFKISIPTLFAINNFTLTIIGFLLMYLALFSVSKSKLLSILLILFFYLISPRQVSRPIIAQLVLPLLFLSPYFIWRFYNSYNSSKTYLFISLTALITGSLVYISPYYWSALFVLFNFVLLARSYLKKDIRFYFKNLFCFLLIFGVSTIPYLINLFKAMRSPWYGETIKRLGLIDTHWPGSLNNALLIIIALLAAALIYKKIEKSKLLFCLTILFSGIILNWQNVITGKYLLFSTHYLDITVFFVLLAVGIIASEIIKIINARDSNIRAIASILLLATVVSLLGLQNRNEVGFLFNSAYDKSKMEKLQKMADTFDWLNNNTVKDSVLFTLGGDGYTRNILYPIYTYNNLYYGGVPGMSLISNDELLERYLISNIFNDDFAVDFVKNNAYRIRAVEFISQYQKKIVKDKVLSFITRKKYPDPIMIPDSFNDEAINKFVEIKKINPEQALKKYGIDYILLSLDDPEYASQREKLKQLSFLKPIQEINNILIYKVN